MTAVFAILVGGGLCLALLLVTAACRFLDAKAGELRAREQQILLHAGFISLAEDEVD